MCVQRPKLRAWSSAAMCTGAGGWPTPTRPPGRVLRCSRMCFGPNPRPGHSPSRPKAPSAQKKNEGLWPCAPSTPPDAPHLQSKPWGFKLPFGVRRVRTCLSHRKLPEQKETIKIARKMPSATSSKTLRFRASAPSAFCICRVCPVYSGCNLVYAG